jgi:glucose/arabinose dehydrogenase
VPPGFRIEQYAAGFRNPRFLLTAPNGALLFSEDGNKTIWRVSYTGAK